MNGRAEILIVEDNATNVFILRAMLARLGHDALVARDGIEGVAMAEAHRPRLVLMDLRMPNLDGMAAAAEIRRRLSDDCPLFVAVTATVTTQQRAICEQAGFAGLLAKPVDLDELARTVRRCLDGD